MSIFSVCACICMSMNTCGSVRIHEYIYKVLNIINVYVYHYLFLFGYIYVCVCILKYVTNCLISTCFRTVYKYLYWPASCPTNRQLFTKSKEDRKEDVFGRHYYGGLLWISTKVLKIWETLLNVVLFYFYETNKYLS